MSDFNFEKYAAAKAAAESKKQGVKVGFFKLADRGEALVRFMVTGVQDLYGATLHKVKSSPEKNFQDMSVSCINEYGTKDDRCPLCKAAAAGDDRVSKVAKYGYVRMLVSYKNADGSYTAPVPVVWERKWNWLQTEMTSKLANYGDLTQHLFKISRTGAGLETRYTVDYAVPAIYKPEMVPADFKAFDNFDISKHSYWVKTVEECETYLVEGKFPAVKKDEAPVEAPKTVAEVAAPVVETPVAPAPAPVKEEPKGNFGNSFGGFSF